MAFFFPILNTNYSDKEIEHQEVIVNLDDFDSITRNDTIIIAEGESKSTAHSTNSVVIAKCKTIKAAQYVMRKILRKEVVTINEVRAIEEDAPNF